MNRLLCCLSACVLVILSAQAQGPPVLVLSSFQISASIPQNKVSLAHAIHQDFIDAIAHTEQVHILDNNVQQSAIPEILLDSVTHYMYATIENISVSPEIRNDMYTWGASAYISVLIQDKNAVEVSRKEFFFSSNYFPFLCDGTAPAKTESDAIALCRKNIHCKVHSHFQIYFPLQAIITDFAMNENKNNIPFIP